MREKLSISQGEGRNVTDGGIVTNFSMLIEAAMIACNIPPNLNRKEFGFQARGTADKSRGALRSILNVPSVFEYDNASI